MALGQKCLFSKQHNFSVHELKIAKAGITSTVNFKLAYLKFFWIPTETGLLFNIFMYFL